MFLFVCCLFFFASLLQHWKQWQSNVISDDWSCVKGRNLYFYGTGTKGSGYDWCKAWSGMIDIMLSIRHPLVIVRHLVGHSRPASVGSLRFVYFFMYRYCSVTWNPSTSEGLWHCIGWGNTFPVLIAHRGFSVFHIRQCHRLSLNGALIGGVWMSPVWISNFVTSPFRNVPISPSQFHR